MQVLFSTIAVLNLIFFFKPLDTFVSFSLRA